MHSVLYRPIRLSAWALSPRALGEDTLQRCRRVLGPDDTRTLWLATDLTLARVSVGEAEAARALGEDTLQRCRRVLGPDHARTLWAATGLILALVQLGEAKPARALGQDTLQRCRRVFGPSNPIALYLTRAVGSGQLLLRGDAAADHPSRPQLTSHHPPGTWNLA